MEDNILELVKSYIASEERLRLAQTRLLKKKIGELNDEIYQSKLTNDYLQDEITMLNTMLRDQINRSYKAEKRLVLYGILLSCSIITTLFLLCK